MFTLNPLYKTGNTNLFEDIGIKPVDSTLLSNKKDSTMDDNTSITKKNKTGKPRVARVNNPVSKINWYTDLPEFATFKITDIFTDYLYIVAKMRQYYESKKVVSDISIDNYSTQSICNRDNKMRVKTTGKIGNKLFTTFTPLNFMPARSPKDATSKEYGFNPNDKCFYGQTGYAGNWWSNCLSRSWKVATSLESMALLGYLVYQLNTGQLVSSESTFKTDMLHTGLNVFKFSSLSIELYPRPLNDEVIYKLDLSDVNNLTLANQWRVKLLHDLPPRDNVRKSSNKTSGFYL